MARRPAAKKVTKPKAVKLGKMATMAMNLKSHGGEPSKNDVYEWTWISAYNWYNYNCDSTDAKKFLVAYLADHNHPDAKAISKIDERWVHGYASTICWMARMASNGYSLKDDRKEFFDKRLAFLIEKNEQILLEKEESREGSYNKSKDAPVVDKSFEEYVEVFNFFEDCFDKEDYVSPYAHLTSISASRALIQRLYNRYAPYLRELEELFSDKPDPQLIEYYSTFKVAKVKKQFAYVKQIMTDCERFLDNKKAARKPRKKKTVPVETKLRNFNYQKNDITFNLTSFNPLKIFEAKEIWTYNTKYHIVTVYRTDTEFDVKGTTLLNYNEVTSYSKRVGSRNSNTAIQSILDSGKVGLRTLMDKLKGAPQQLKGRIGENTILLKFTT